MDQILSIHEMRRRAPLHFWAKADNARFTAYAIWTLKGSGQKQPAEQIGYGGSPEIAMREAFYREASVALELIVKAVIAQRIEGGIAMKHVVKVRPAHDLVSLWKDAQLPILLAADLHRLIIARRTLYWAGRYAAPLEDEQFEREQREMAPLIEKEPSGKSKLFISKSRSFAWEDFDKIYENGRSVVLANQGTG